MAGLSLWSWLDIQGLLIISAVVLLFADYIKNRRPNNFPPGPLAMPFVGNMFSVDFNKAHENLTQLSEKYGDVYSLRMGPTWMVVVNRLKTLKEALVTQGDSLADRPMMPLSDECSPNQGILITNGHMWKQQRRFALFTLKYLGVGKKSLESAIVDENIYLSNEIADYKGRPFNPHMLINNAVSNIICSLVFGHRFDYDDEKFVNLLKWLDQAMQIEGSIWAEMYNSYPTLMKCVPGPHHTVQTIYRHMMEFMRSELEKHKEDWDPSDPRDYTDCYLTEIQKSKGDADAEATFYENNLVTCTLDLFVAGSETTSTTLRWGLLYMTMYPKIQEKVQAEIDSVIGQSRQPSVADRANMPYTDAVIHEIQRMGNIVPLSLPHMTTRDVQLGGYTVPKGVKIIPNLSSALFDKNEWETPSTFNPGHFLNEEGKFVKHASFIPFSAGKRVCLGENLARMELFLFFVSLMQKFSFSMPAGVKPVLDYRFGLTLAPVSYEICANERQA